MGDVPATFEPDEEAQEIHGLLVAALTTSFETAQDDSLFLQELVELAARKPDAVTIFLFGHIFAMWIQLQEMGFDIAASLQQLGEMGAKLNAGINPDPDRIVQTDDGTVVVDGTSEGGRGLG